MAASDIRANDVLLTGAASGRWVEHLLRSIATTCGSVLAVCGCHTGRQIKQHAHLGSYSRAMTPEQTLAFVDKEQQTWLPVLDKISK